MRNRVVSRGQFAYAKASPPASPQDAQRTKLMKIVLADDNHDSADSMAMLLGAFGHEVEVAYDGIAAVKAAETHKPDFVLLDIGMPDMNGYECAREIRKQAWSAGAVLVALTGWGQEEDKRRSQEAGFDLHLTKPVDPDALEKALQAGKRNP